MLRRLRTLALFVCFTACVAASSTAHAGPGVRVGVTDGPDSLFGGVFWQFELTQIGPGRLRIQPGVDLGIVEGPIDVLIKGSAHFALEFDLGNNLRLYPIFGPIATMVFRDNNNDDNIDLGIGLDLGVGFGVDRFLFELWAGIEDSPNLTFAFGILF